MIRALIRLTAAVFVVGVLASCGGNGYGQDTQIDLHEPYIDEIEVVEDEIIEDITEAEETAEHVEEILEDVTLEQRLAEFMEMRRDNIRGLAISIFTIDDMIFELTYGYADTEAGLAIGPDTVFEWGSVAKLLVYVAAMQLHEQGRLDLHADIFTYIDSEAFPNIVYLTTMYHLIHHTAGFNEAGSHEFEAIVWGRWDMVDSSIPTLAEVLREVSALESTAQITPPGQRIWYSNYGIALAGYVVQQAAGVPFYQYVHDNIFAPLGMYHTALLPDLSDNEWVSRQRDEIKVYDAWGPMFTQRMLGYIYPAGAAVGTISDMVAFARGILPDENGESALFANAETLARLHPSVEDILNAPVFDSDIVFMYGFVAYPHRGGDFAPMRVVGHSGSLPGFVSSLYVDLDRGIGMVMSENAGFFGLSSAPGFREFFTHEIPRLALN